LEPKIGASIAILKLNGVLGSKGAAWSLGAIGSFLIGLRWRLDWPAVLSFAALSAVAMNVTVFLAFRSLWGRDKEFKLSSDWVHCTPLLLVGLARLLEPAWLDIDLLATNIFYALLLFRLLRQAPDSLSLVRLGWLNSVTRAM